MRSSHATSLKNTDFRDADLTCAEFRDADLTGADFRGAILDKVDLRTWNLKGVRFDIAQAIQLAQCYGVRIEEDNVRSG